MSRVSIDTPRAFADTEAEAPRQGKASERSCRLRETAVSSSTISIATVAALLLFWWLSTGRGWIPPLFLPSPGDVLKKFWVVSTRGYMDATAPAMSGKPARR